MARSERDHLTRLATEVRRVYFDNLRRFHLRVNGTDRYSGVNDNTIKGWDGGRDHRGVVHQSKWEAIVRFATKHRVDPVSLVNAVFDCAIGRDPPKPNQIISAKALESLENARINMIADLKLRYAGYAEEAEQAFLFWRKNRRVSEEQVWREVIASSELSLTPIFRFCLASSLKLDQAATFWRNEAIQEYVRAPDAYNKVLGNAVPSDFREESERLLRLLH
jgi:hypothetical protein